MPDWTSHLGQLADRGEQRGAAEVFRRARAELSEMRPDVRRSRRGPLVSAAVGVLLIAAGVAFMLRAETGKRVRVTGPAPLDLAAGWTRHVKASAGIGDASLNGVAKTTSGFVAVGAPSDPGRASAPVAVWTSPTGRRWTALTPDELPANAVHLDAVAGQPDGTSWIVGSDDSGPAVWRSSGRSWSRSAGGPNALEQAESFRGLTATATDLVAFGGTIDGRGGTWSSRDGKAWRLAQLPGPVDAVAATADRLIALVAIPGVGSRADVVFTSADDANTWARGTEVGTTIDPAGEALTCNDAGCWAATGPIGNPGSPILWRSDDGLRWNRVNATLTTDGSIDTLTIVDGYVVAAGFDHDLPAGWVSADGESWSAMPELARTPGGRLNIVAANSKTLAAFGSASELNYFFTWEAP